jgi:aminoglycoside 6'-N-acetyltransferase
MYALLSDDHPIGMIQASPADPQLGFSWDAWGIDLLIGETAMLGQGYGARAIDDFVTAELFGRHSCSLCLADPHAENRRSIRAFEKAGFRSHRRFEADGEPYVLMIRNRAEPSP